MKNLKQNVTQLPVVNASDSTDTNKRFSFTNSLKTEGSKMMAKMSFANVLLTCLFLSFSFTVVAGNTITITTTQNGKNATIVATMCPWNPGSPDNDKDFKTPSTSDDKVVGLVLATKSTETINGVSCRKMIVQVFKKKPGNSVVTISQENDNLGQAATPQVVDFTLFDDIVSMSIANHVGYGNFITNGFHPGEVSQCMLKIIDTETGNDNLSAHGTAKVSIIGTGFTFNNNALNKTVSFVNGVASVTLHANQPNSGYCFFQIKDDTLPTSVGGSDVLHIAKISLTPAPMSIQFNTNNVACGTTNTGSATAMVTGGTSPYLYSFNNGPATNNMNISGLTAGVYNVMITDFWGTTSSAIFSIAAPPVLNISASVEQPFCSPNGLGSIHVSVDGASSPINYLWNDGSMLDTRTNLLPGNYFVEAVDANGCSTAKTFNLTSVNPGLVVVTPADIITNTEPGKDYAFVKYHVDYHESCTGYVDISVYPVSGSAFYKGITNVSYKAIDGSGQSTSGSFNVIVNDDEAPVVSAKDITVNLNANGVAVLTPEMLDDSSSDNCGIISKSVTPNSLSCSNIGSNAVTLTVTDGNNYYWVIDSNGVKYYNNTGVLINTISTVGKVSVIVLHNASFLVSDSNSVRVYRADGTHIATIFTSGNVTITILANGDFVIFDKDNHTVTVCGSDGAIKSIIFTSGNVTITKLPCGGFIINDIDNHTITVCDKDGNVLSILFTSGDVEITVMPDCSFIINDKGNHTVTVCGSDGTVKSIIFTSGNVTIKLLPCGGFIIIDKDNHTVTVCDKDGVVKSILFTSGDVEITVMPDCSFIINDKGNHTVTVCGSDGSVKSIIFTSGNVTITLLPDGGFIINDIGNHTVTVCDKDGNVKSILFTSGNVTITLLPGGGFIINDIGNHTITVCDKDGNVKAILFTSGNVTITVTPDGGFIINDIGNKTVTVCDKDGVVKAIIFTSGNVTITLLPGGGFIINDIGNKTITVCDKDGVVKSILFTSGNVTITLLPCGGFIINDIDNHTVTVCDKDGVVKSIIFTSGDVEITVMPDCSFIINDKGNHTVTVCDKDGVVKSIIFTSGDVTITLTPDGGFIINDKGNHTVTKCDKDGNVQSIIFTSGESSYYINKSLSSSATAMVMVPNPITVTGVVKNIDCSGVKSGKVTLTVSGITGPYTYAWSNSKTTKNLTGLAAGTFAVVITDKNGCNNGASFTVSQPPAMAITMTKSAVKCGGAKTGKATATVTGGTAPYLYSWSTSPVKTTAAVTGLAAGTYTVTVTDGNGCSKTKSVVVPQTYQPIALAQQVTTISITITPSGGVAPYTYLWSNGQTTNTATGLTCGNTYTCTVTDSKGCKATVKIKITCPRFGEQTYDNDLQVNVFPNPTSGNVSVAIANSLTGDYAFELFDATGRKVYSSSEQINSGEQKQLDMSAYEDGIYTLRIANNNKVTTTKIVLQKNN